MAIFALIFMICAVSLSPAMATPAPGNESNTTYNNTNYTLKKSEPIWPDIFANNQSNGQSKNLGPQNNTTKWVFNTSGDNGIGGQTIGADGTIYFTSTSNDNGTVYALNPDGTIKWNLTFENLDSSIAPTIGDNGLLYIMSDYEVPVLTAINPDGTIRWQYTFREYESSVASYPVIGKDGSILVGLNLYDDDNDFTKIYSINPNGTLKWSYKIHRGVEDHIYTFFNSVGQNGALYVGSYFESEDEDYYGVLNAINPDGTLKWNYTFTEDLYKSWGIGSASWGSAVGPDGTIYAAVTSLVDKINEVHLYAFNPSGTVKWMQTINDGAHNFVMGLPSVASNGVVYLTTMFGTSDKDAFNNLHAFSPNGTKLWNYTQPALGEGFSSQVIGTDGTIYLASMGSPLIALNPDGTEKWKYNYPVYGIPSINKDGTLYIGIWGFEANSTTSLHAIAGQQSDLYLKTLVDNKNPKVGDTVKITFKVGNNGPGTAYNTTMTLKIPKGLQFIKALAQSGTFTYDGSTSTITWYLGDLGVIDPYLNVWTKVLAKGTYAISPILSTLTYDPNLARNTQSIVINAQAASNNSTDDVGMQHTGVPIGAAIVAFLMVLGGIVSSKKRK
ncbi:MAG: PQQ-binding-like beta-propeller repeat protein [Methanobacteriaceae archaeon]|jgi:uncharacterized repeat protein (TIGR01451 family)|nr:PQQ-binding-like beta-propeller repeat protein [Methanobacteriaceae archaeon]MDO9626865.1 PQQ-binding-like beta-propeller repeat protein [Methanobacteriaceae archaeon]